MNKELLLRYFNGDCTDQEKADISIWLDSDPENMKEFLALRKLYDITIWQPSSETKPVQKDKKKATSWLGEVLKIAAIFIVAILVSYYFLPKSSDNKQVAMQTLCVPSGQRAEITLGDGTKVWLNAKTTLTFPNQFSGKTREVQLDGEAFFDVVSNKSKPFIVKTQKYNVKVWGTRFNLMAYSEKGIFETSLFEGSVEVLKPGISNGSFIRPQERIFLKDNQMVVAPITDTNRFLWKEGIISFDDESFPELVNRLELYFDLKIEVKNDEILKYRCTGKFRTKDGIEHILKVLQRSNNFSYKIDDKLNVITIE
jgi:ferric-dicitrate binding protein FerR (iron transport regulator)